MWLCIKIALATVSFLSFVCDGCVCVCVCSCVSCVLTFSIENINYKDDTSFNKETRYTQNIVITKKQASSRY